MRAAAQLSDTSAPPPPPRSLSVNKTLERDGYVLVSRQKLSVQISICDTIRRVRSRRCPPVPSPPQPRPPTCHERAAARLRQNITKERPATTQNGDRDRERDEKNLSSTIGIVGLV